MVFVPQCFPHSLPRLSYGSLSACLVLLDRFLGHSLKMEIMLSPTGTYSSTAVPLEDPHPEVELAPPHQFEPIVIPRQMSPLSSSPTPEITRLPSVRSKLGHRARADSVATDACAKRESYNLTGTTFLITNDGRTLKLPVASESNADPLNWSDLKTAGAFFAIVFYSAVCLTAAQAPAVMLDSIQNTFKHEVRRIGLFHMNTLLTNFAEHSAMADQSPRYRPSSFHGYWMFCLGATLHRLRPSTNSLDRHHDCADCYTRGISGTIFRSTSRCLLFYRS